MKTAILGTLFTVGLAVSVWAEDIYGTPLDLPEYYSAIEKNSHYYREVIFTNWEGTEVLQRDTLVEGAMPKYRGELPQDVVVEGDSFWMNGAYVFRGWTNSFPCLYEGRQYSNFWNGLYDGREFQGDCFVLVYDSRWGSTAPQGIRPVEKNALYVPVYEWVPNVYEITFQDKDGNFLEKYEVEHGEYAYFSGENRDDVSWTLEPERESAKRNMTYTVYPGYYRVRFVRDDGYELYKNWVEPGKTYREEWLGTPTKENDACHSYEFVGWDKEFAPITEPMTYTALFKETLLCENKPSYKVKFYNGNELVHEDVYTQGEMPAYRGERDASEFAAEMELEWYEEAVVRWEPEFAPITADMEYHAVTQKKNRSFSVYTHDENLGWVNPESVEYGAMPDLPAVQLPAPDETCKQYAVKWSHYINDVYGEGIVPVTGETYYMHKFECIEPTTFTITYLNDDGSVFMKRDLVYGAWPEIYAVPIKTFSPEHDYEFKGWTPEFKSVTEDATYTAQYEETPRHYWVMFVNDNEELIEIADGEWDAQYPYGTPYDEIVKPQKNPEHSSTQTAEEESNTQSTLGGFPFSGAVFGEGMPRSPTPRTRYEFDGWQPNSSNLEHLVENTIFTATYKKKFAVRFVDYNGNVLKDDDFYDEGTPLSQIVKPDDPTRESVGDVEYTFAGWMPAMEGTLTEPMTFVASYEAPNANTVTIGFADEHGNIIERQEVVVGELPVCCGWTPRKEEDDEFTYSWDPDDGWDKPIEAAFAPAVYKPKFVKTPKKYTVTFKDVKGNVIREDEYGYGEIITSFPSEAEAVDGVGEYYYFDGWRDENSWNFPLRVTRDATYNAVVIYAVYFNNYAGFHLNSMLIGSIIDLQRGYDYLFGQDKVWNEVFHDWNKKASSEKYDYTWNEKWDKELDIANGTTTYTAVLDSSLRKFDVAFVNEDGSELPVNVDGEMETSVSYEYGTEASEIVTPENPTKAPSISKVYSFDGWKLAEVTEDVTYKATFTAAPRPYDVTFVDEAGSVIQTYLYGTSASEIVPPEAAEKDGYKFARWVPELSKVTGNATYTAQYIENSKFLVTWVDYDGTILDEEIYENDETPEYKKDSPARASTDGYTYSFAGWDVSENATAGNREYRATYIATKRKYTVTFVNYNDSVLSTAEYEYRTPVADIMKPADPKKPSTVKNEYIFAGWTPRITDVTGNVTYKALFGSNSRDYKVTLLNADGSVWSEERFKYYDFSLLAWGPDVYTAECRYDFDHWEPVEEYGEELNKNRVYVAVGASECHVRSYNVQFYDPLRDQWSGGDYGYGTAAADIVPDIKDSVIDGCHYTFNNRWKRHTLENGWVEVSEVDDVVGYAAYEAVYDNDCIVDAYPVAAYPVAFVVDGDTVATLDIEEGANPLDYAPTDISRAATVQYSYTLSGWTPEIVDVTGPAVYTAVIDSTVNTYWLKFAVDGRALSYAEYAYGTAAEDIETPKPTKNSTAKYSFSFAGWSPEIADVTGPATYNAMFDTTINKYTIAFAVDGDTISSAEYLYGTIADSIVRPEVTKAATAKCTYKFVGWNQEIASVTKAVTYNARFDSVVNTYVLKFVIEGDTVSMEYPYGTSDIKVPDAVKADTEDSTYTFDGWDKEISSVTGNAVYVAKFTAKEIEKVVPPDSSDAIGVMSRTAFKFGFADNAITVVQSSPAMVHVQVFDLNGQQVASFSEQVVGSKSFSLESLEKGSYLVRVMSKSQNKTARIVVK